MGTTNLGLYTLTAGVSTRANLISHWNSNMAILDAMLSNNIWCSMTNTDGVSFGAGQTKAGLRMSAGSDVHGMTIVSGNIGHASGLGYITNFIGVNCFFNVATGYIERYSTEGGFTCCQAISMSADSGQLGGNRIGFWLGAAAGALGEEMCLSSTGLYVVNDVSAATFTDRTLAFMKNALSAIEKIKADAKGEIDHATLPEEAISPYQDGKGEWWPGRSLGDMISILVKATQERSAQFAAAVADRDTKIRKLEERMAALEKLLTKPAKV